MESAPFSLITFFSSQNHKKSFNSIVTQNQSKLLQNFAPRRAQKTK